MYEQFSIFDYCNNDILIDGNVYQSIHFEPFVKGVLHIVSEKDINTYDGNVIHLYNCYIIDHHGKVTYFGNHAAKDFVFIN